MIYDCTKDVKEHIARVQKWMWEFSNRIIDRSSWHDKSKLEEPEKPVFDEYTPKLKELVFGSEEYKAALAGMGAGLKHHYQENRHHPEHYENGINGMTLVDLIEMVSDWMAAAQAKDTHIDLAYLAKRFNISDQLVEIIANTLREDDLWRMLNGAAIDGEYCPPEMRDRNVEGFERIKKMDNQPEPNQQRDPFMMTLGNLKFALATLEEEREKRGRTPGTRYIAVAITDLEKLIAYAEKYLTPEYL